MLVKLLSFEELHKVSILVRFVKETKSVKNIMNSQNMSFSNSQIGPQVHTNKVSQATVISSAGKDDFT